MLCMIYSEKLFVSIVYSEMRKSNSVNIIKCIKLYRPYISINLIAASLRVEYESGEILSLPGHFVRQ